MVFSFMYDRVKYNLVPRDHWVFGQQEVASRDLPLTKKPVDSGYEIVRCQSDRSITEEFQILRQRLLGQRFVAERHMTSCKMVFPVLQ